MDLEWLEWIGGILAQTLYFGSRLFMPRIPVSVRVIESDRLLLLRDTHRRDITNETWQLQNTSMNNVGLCRSQPHQNVKRTALN